MSITMYRFSNKWASASILILFVGESLNLKKMLATFKKMLVARH